MYKKEVPKLNKEDFPAWKSLMKLHISRLGDTSWTSVKNRYTTITGIPTSQQLKEKKEHNQAMLGIASALSYSKYDDIKKCRTTK